MKNNIPTVNISQIHFCIVKALIFEQFLAFFPFCTKNIKKLKIKKYRVVMATLDATTRACIQCKPITNNSS